MPGVSKEDREMAMQVLAGIKDEKIRYFYLMLGDAIASYFAENGQTSEANTGPDHIEELARRLNVRRAG